MVEDALQSCIPCLAVTKCSSTAPPIKPHELPRGPWQEVEMDLQGPYPGGEYIFIVIDRYSKWVEMATFQHAPNADEVKTALDHIFYSQGVPFRCQADNGPPFQSKELRRYARKQGFTLKHITPEWPWANGEVERFNRTMKEAVQKGAVENRSIKEAARTFLRTYRATPHTTTGVSPFDAMYGRRMKIDLPLEAESSMVVDRSRVERSQEKMASRKGREHDL